MKYIIDFESWEGDPRDFFFPKEELLLPQIKMLWFDLAMKSAP